MRRKPDPDCVGFQYREASVQTRDDMDRLEGLSRRGWCVVASLGGNMLLLSRDPRWQDEDE